MILVGVVCQSAITVNAQSSFQNLNFELAQLISIPGDAYGRVQFLQAFPGWTGTANNISQSRAMYNDFFLNSAGIGLENSTFNYAGVPLGGPIQGNFTAFLEAGLGLGTGSPADASLSQTGLIPSGTETLLFSAQSASGNFGVSLGGQQLAFTAVGSGNNYTLYSADIHAWAGQNTTLAFTAFANPVEPGMVNFLFLDSISFSPVAVPEPETYALCLLGLLGLCFYKKQKKKQPNAA